MMQRCVKCSKFQYPPDVACIHCQSTQLEPEPVSGRARLYSYTAVDRAFNQGFVNALPYLLGLVELDEQPGLRMVTNIVDAEPAVLRVGMALQVTFEDRGDVALPQFRPAEAGS